MQRLSLKLLGQHIERLQPVSQSDLYYLNAKDTTQQSKETKQTPSWSLMRLQHPMMKKEFNAWAANFLNQSHAKVSNIISNWLAQRNEREAKSMESNSRR